MAPPSAFYDQIHVQVRVAALAAGGGGRFAVGASTQYCLFPLHSSAQTAAIMHASYESSLLLEACANPGLLTTRMDVLQVHQASRL